MADDIETAENKLEERTDRIRTESLYAAIQLDSHRAESATADTIVDNARVFENFIAGNQAVMTKGE